MFVFCGSFLFFLEIQIMLFCCRSTIPRSTSCVHLPLCYLTCYFKSDIYKYFLVQIECLGCWKIILSVFDAPIVHMSCYCLCKERNNWNELHIQYRTNHPIFEIATSHVCRLKKTRNQCFFKRVRAQCYILCVSNG